MTLQDPQTADIDTIIEDFELLDDWEDRYRYLIELGDRLPGMAEADKSGANKVQGCASQVWITTSRGEGEDPELTFVGDSDAHIVRGLIAVVLAIFSGKKASQILDTDETAIFDSIRLSEHITRQRSNGLRSMVGRIKQEATQALS